MKHIAKPDIAHGRQQKFFVKMLGAEAEDIVWTGPPSAGKDLGHRGYAAAFVLTLDLRYLRSGSTHQFSRLSPTLSMIDCLSKCVTTFEQLRCLVLDGQADSNAKKMNAGLNAPPHHLRLLSLAHCQVLLPLNFFSEGTLASLSYLDLSYTSGWARSLLGGPTSFVTYNLPNLRVLKLAGKSMDNADAENILNAFGHQLWSIDLSCNKLHDNLIPILTQSAIASEHWARLQSDQFFQVEGTLEPAERVPWAFFVKESSHSASFNHPDRYLADTPLYTVNHESDDISSWGQRGNRARLKGNEPMRGDLVNDMIKILAGSPNEDVVPTPEIAPPAGLPGTITHIHLNGLDLSLKSVEYLLRKNAGWMELFECDQARYLPVAGGIDDFSSGASRSWRGPRTLYGFPGAAYLFRPVYQSNLRALKIHHSLVTNVPTVSDKNARVFENAWRAETVFCKQNDLAYPQLLTPDLNPRLCSLTLSHIPRHSTGLVIARLINLLKLAATQEQDIARTRKSIPPRGPPVVCGLRHIRLEFEPDASRELASIENGEDVNAAMDAFASFSQSTWDSSLSISSTLPPKPSHPQSNSRVGSMCSSASITPGDPDKYENKPGPSGGRLTTGPYEKIVRDEFYEVKCPYATETDQTVWVWIGSGIISAHNTSSVNAYMRILAACSSDSRHSLMRDFAPLTPSHIAAGVPAERRYNYIFHRAWDRILVPSPRDIARKPTMAELRGMKDVLEEMKAFRMETRKRYQLALSHGRGGNEHLHGHWTGTLEIDLPLPRTDSMDSWQ